MLNQEKKQIISNAICDFKKAKYTGDKKKIAFELNNLYNVYIMFSQFNVEGIEKVRQLILNAA